MSNSTGRTRRLSLPSKPVGCSPLRHSSSDCDEDRANNLARIRAHTTPAFLDANTVTVNHSNQKVIFNLNLSARLKSATPNNSSHNSSHNSSPDSPFLARSRSEGHQRSTLKPIIEEEEKPYKYQELGVYDFNNPEPQYGMGDYHQYELAVIAHHREKQSFDDYLRQHFPEDKLEFFCTKIMLLANNGVQENRIHQVLDQLTDLEQRIAVLLATRLIEKAREVDRAYYLMIAIDLGHTGRAKAVAALMKKRLVERVAVTPRTSAVFRSNLRGYGVNEKLYRSSENPRYQRALPVLDDPHSILFICANNPTIRMILPKEELATYLKQPIQSVAKKIAKKCDLPIDQIKIQFGPGEWVLDPKRSFYEQNVNPGSVLFF